MFHLAEEAVGLNLTKIHPKLKIIVRNLPRVSKALGFEVRITSGYRDYVTQARLYREYLAGVSHYPANPPGTSKHEKGLALDILSTNTNALVNLLQSVGLVWAGPLDPIHFQIGFDSAQRQAVGSPRLNDLTSAKAIPLTRKAEMQLLLDAVNRKIMKPW